MRKIATKVLKQINKANARKVIDLNEYRQQKKATEDLYNQITTTEKAIKTGHDPLHAVYIHTQNLLSILVETLQAIPEPALSRLFNTVEAADDAYVPSSPPMSPLTKSYFNCWLLRNLQNPIKRDELVARTAKKE